MQYLVRRRSNNPNGRPRGPNTLARAVREAWPVERLVELASQLAASEDDSIRLRALEWLSARGHGAVPQVVDLHASAGPREDDGFEDMTADELRAAIDERRALLLGAGRDDSHRSNEPKTPDEELALAHLVTTGTTTT